MCLHRLFTGYGVEQQFADVDIGTFRKIYGPRFAAAFLSSHPLRGVVARLDRQSLDLLLADAKSGLLAELIEQARRADSSETLHPGCSGEMA